MNPFHAQYSNYLWVFKVNPKQSSFIFDGFFTSLDLLHRPAYYEKVLFQSKQP